MADKKIARNFPKTTCVVGTIHSNDSLKAALHLAPGTVDFLEVRVDAFCGHESKILPVITRLKFPLIITVRSFLEGGLHKIPAQKRRELFHTFMPHAALIDIELRTAKSLAGVIESAQKSKVGVIISYHNFKTTPAPNRLVDIAKKARDIGADVVKIATLTSDASDVSTLIAFQRSQKHMALSLMGMGSYGKISRLLFAQTGSVLNYGFLEKAQVHGQWPAGLLKRRIQELSAA